MYAGFSTLFFPLSDKNRGQGLTMTAFSTCLFSIVIKETQLSILIWFFIGHNDHKKQIVCFDSNLILDRIKLSKVLAMGMKLSRFETEDKVVDTSGLRLLF